VTFKNNPRGSRPLQTGQLQRIPRPASGSAGRTTGRKTKLAPRYIVFTRQPRQIFSPRR
jgi:hypothetical protein